MEELVAPFAATLIQQPAFPSSRISPILLTVRGTGIACQVTYRSFLPHPKNAVAVYSQHFFKALLAA
jgi:hypothetical protein